MFSVLCLSVLRSLLSPAIKVPLCTSKHPEKKSISVTYVGQLNQFCPEKSDVQKGHIAFDIFCQHAIKCFVQIYLNVLYESPRADIYIYIYLLFFKQEIHTL